MSTTYSDLAWRAPRRRGLALDLRRLRDAAPLALLLCLTGALYLWALGHNGYANEYYAAAVKAGTESWKAFLFGSLDPANYITVDKPPASLWLMELSTRAFGFSSLSLLAPQALEGIAAVGVLYATVKRWFGRPAALLSGLTLALTPVAALMFRFDNPDALLLLLLVLAAWALTRAIESGATRWMAAAGTALGFAFLTKELQAFIVIPAFVLAYLLAAPGSVRRRLGALAAGGAALILSAGWWIALVELWPAGSRPYIGGSTDNSVLQLIFGYNGLQRISSGGGGGGLGFSGSAGILRLFNAELGGQISWLLPAALIAIVTGAVVTLRRSRSDRTRAAVLLWGGWLLLTAAVFSFMTGIIHPYYPNMLAPPIAASVGVGAVLLWRSRERLGARLVLAAMLAVSAVWSYALLDRAPAWHPWLRATVLVAGLLGAVAITLTGARARGVARRGLAVGALTVALAGPVAYTLSAVATAQTGSNPSAGPAVATGRLGGAGGFGAPGGAGGSGAPGGAAGGGQSTSEALVKLIDATPSSVTWAVATTSAQTAAPLELATGRAVMAIGGFSGNDNGITLARFEALVRAGKIRYYVAGGGGGGAPGGGAFGTGGGRAFPRAARMGLPGPAGTRLHGMPGHFRAGGTGPGQGVAAEIETWVAAHFKSITVGGVTVYELTQAKGA